MGEIKEACPRCVNGTSRSSVCVILGVVTTYYVTSLQRQRVGYEGNKVKSTLTCADLNNYIKRHPDYYVSQCTKGFWIFLD